MNSNIDIEVRRLLELRRGEWHQIAKRCAVSHSWISKFVNSRIPNPGYATLVRLHAHLGEQSNVAKAAALVEGCIGEAAHA